MKKEARKLIKSSEQKKTQKEIEIARKYVDDIINLNPYSIQICDKDGYHIRVNQAFMDLFKTLPPPGWSLLKDPILKKAGHQELIRKVKSGETVEIPETWYNPHDLSPKLPDNRICLSSVHFPILNPDGEIENIVIMHKDITELKKAQEEVQKAAVARKTEKILKEKEDHYRSLVQIIPDIIYKVDPNGIFTFISESVKQLGYTPEELIGKHFKEIIHPDDFEKVSRQKVLPKYAGKITGNTGSPKLFNERRTGNRMTKNLEVRLLLKKQKEVSRDYRYAKVYSTGSWKVSNKKEGISIDYHYGEVNSSGKWDKPVTEKNKNFIESIGFIRDITELKRAEEKEKKLLVAATTASAEKKRAVELEKAYKKLENTQQASFNIMEDLDRERKNLEATINELRSTQKNLIQAEKLAGLGELAAGIAHEIRNPLGNILISAELSLGGKEKLSESLKEYLSIILRNSDKANRIIKDLLDFAKPRDISFKMCDISHVIKSACSLAKARCSSQNVHLITKYSKKLPQILLDEQHLEEAFLNFIMNALDFMPDSGEMTISAYPDDENNEVVANFLDTGHGISEKILGKVFDPFFTTRDEGTGLGLSLAYQVINYHKGKIEVKSKPGQGTEITVRLPIAGNKAGDK